MAAHFTISQPLNHAPDVSSRLVTCKRCGDNKLTWCKSRRTGKHYLADVQESGENVLRYYALAMRPHRCHEPLTDDQIAALTALANRACAPRPTLSQRAQGTHDAYYRLMVEMRGSAAVMRQLLEEWLSRDVPRGVTDYNDGWADVMDAVTTIIKIAVQPAE